MKAEIPRNGVVTPLELRPGVANGSAWTLCTVRDDVKPIVPLIADAPSA
jgi:hypothetical protein